MAFHGGIISFARRGDDELGMEFKPQYGKKAKDYYLKLQNYHSLGARDHPVRILLKLNVRLTHTEIKNYPLQDCNAGDLSSNWLKCVKQSIREINFATPGLDLVWIDMANEDDEKSDRNYKHIIFVKGATKGGCWTLHNINSTETPLVCLQANWCGKYNEREYIGTGIHEILHALGTQHEHQRDDAKLNGVVMIQCPGKHELQQFKAETDRFSCDACKKKCKKGSDLYGCRKCNYDLCVACNHNCSRMNYIGLTPYDPYSVMHYETCKFDVDKNKWSAIHIQKGSFSGNRMTCLSPLDKIGLNIVFKPCQRSKSYVLNGVQYPSYNPSLSNKTNLLYCGRRDATKGHNYPGKDLTDGWCGPSNGASCASCRVLKNRSIRRSNDKGKTVWLGWSNIFYCGGKNDSKQRSDGTCGPNQGPPCTSCDKLNSGATKRALQDDIVYCPGKHQLNRFATPKDGYGCDKCKKRCSKGTILYGCRKCNYDLCGYCYSR